jgi:hypothetical protein
MMNTSGFLLMSASLIMAARLKVDILYRIFKCGLSRQRSVSLKRIRAISQVSARNRVGTETLFDRIIVRIQERADGFTPRTKPVKTASALSGSRGRSMTLPDGRLFPSPAICTIELSLNSSNWVSWRNCKLTY